MNILDKDLIVTMPDGSKWSVPVSLVAESHARHYAEVNDCDFELALKEDTLPLFERSKHEIFDWASNNMNWSEVESQATQIKPSNDVDFDEGWVNGDKEIK